MFTDEQKKQLSAPLDRSHVAARKQGGRNLSYIEGWHAIAEANRIFGFDAWSRETVELKCVSERDRAIGDRKEPGFGVTYIARVRVRIGELIREGSGTGHGIDRDLGLAHESALKEAETDAMKRALMTFGNPFGLALYDKTQANVSDGTDMVPGEIPESKAQSVEPYKKMEREIDACRSVEQLRLWGAGNIANKRKLPLDWQLTLSARYEDKMADLKQMETV